jgi:hypothetical protein
MSATAASTTSALPLPKSWHIQVDNTLPLAAAERHVIDVFNAVCDYLCPAAVWHFSRLVAVWQLGIDVQVLVMFDSWLSFYICSKLFQLSRWGVGPAEQSVLLIELTPVVPSFAQYCAAVASSCEQDWQLVSFHAFRQV